MVWAQPVIKRARVKTVALMGSPFFRHGIGIHQPLNLGHRYSDRPPDVDDGDLAFSDLPFDRPPAEGQEASCIRHAHVLGFDSCHHLASQYDKIRQPATLRNLNLQSTESGV